LSADHAVVGLPPELAPLFEPFDLCGVRLANRIAMAPMTRGFSPSGVPGDDVAGYYARRAASGVGLLITEGVGVDHPAALGGSGVDGDNAPHMYGEAALAGWRRVVEQVHAVGGVIAPQLWHQGVMREQGTGPHPDAVSVRPSGIWGPLDRQTLYPDGYMSAVAPVTAPMTEEEIADVVAAYGRSAAHAARIGFDAIAIHGAHGYLIDSFLWDGTNLRDDAWGGDRVRRARFAVEVVKAIRAEARDLPIIFRFSQLKQQDVRARLADTPSELEKILGPISDAGVDVFDGSQRYFDTPVFEGSPLNLGGWAKKLTGKVGMSVGGVGLPAPKIADPAQAMAEGRANLKKLAARLERGEFELIGVGRALMNDPDWVRRLMDGRPFLPVTAESRDSLT
jgi:2,4-dienoyl-CoA reductase-like NADH-dependent reductase (Old Yellow Enzyme family)